MRSMGPHPLSTQFSVLFGQIQETEPIGGTYDVEWMGPYFIPRARQWYRSRFLLFGATTIDAPVEGRQREPRCIQSKGATFDPP